jgi:hypothetical protein
MGYVHHYQLIVSGTFCTDTATQQVVITPPLPTASFLGQGEGLCPVNGFLR